MKTPWLLMLAGLLAGVSGTAVTDFEAHPSWTNAGQYPAIEVTFNPSTNLVGGDTITITVAANIPALPMIDVFDTTNPASSATISIGDCSVSTPVVTPGNPTTPTKNQIDITLAPSTCVLMAGQAVSFHIPEKQWTNWNPSVGTVVWLQMTTTKDATASNVSAYAASSGLVLTGLSLSSNAIGSTPDITVGFETPAVLHGGDVLTVEAKGLYGLFKSSVTQAAFGPIGSCNANKATSFASADPLNSYILITLWPANCQIPASTHAVFTIASTFVNPLTAPEEGNAVNIELITEDGQWASASFATGAAVGDPLYGAVKWGGAVPSTNVAGREMENLAVTFTPRTDLTTDDTITIAALPNWWILDGVTPAVTTNSATCVGGVTSSALVENYLIITLNTNCNLPASTPVTLTLRTSNRFEFNPAGNTAMVFSIVTSKDQQQLYNQVGYTTQADCRVVPPLAWTPLANISHINDMSMVQTATVASQIGLLDWSDDYKQTCDTTTFVKYSKSDNYPNYVNVAYPGTPEVLISFWGPMDSIPMEAIVRSLPPTEDSLDDLGIKPTPPSQMHLAWLVVVDRMTNYGEVQEEGLFSMRVAAPDTEVVMFFENVGDTGVRLTAGTPMGVGEFATTKDTANPMLIVNSNRVSAFAGYVPAASPSPKDDDSDAAWFGLLALIAIPLLCCSAILAFLLSRKPKALPPPPMEPAPMVMYQQPYPTITEPFFAKDMMPLAVSEIPPPPAIHNPVFMTGAVPAPSPTFFP